ncbi:MAG: hypothetical protein EZS28_004836 [Streblomastix strix]|uniref:Uncharacterized protein n=1 Tax=Streblomastix strix TaxID=222440 RepID=A0A5J4WX41_9EUKA|nr:MAG: hypothetical protein EZS28_004836 [Streblomastix strix]
MSSTDREVQECVFSAMGDEKMAFTKLLLVLAVLSLGKIVRRRAGAEDEDEDVIPFVKDSLYYFPGSVDKDGVLTIDYKSIGNTSLGFFATKTISDFKAYGSGKVDDETFLVVPKDDLSKKEVAKTIDVLDVAKCNAFNEAILTNLYGQLGYTVFAIEGADIAPSITGLIKNSPTKITFKNLPDNLTDAEKEELKDFTITESCATSSGFEDLGLHRSGVTDAVCQPNTALPADGAKCADDSKPKVYLKGYKSAEFGNADVKGLKELLIRFGPVQIYMNSQDLFDIAHTGLLVGWTKDNWLFADYAGGVLIVTEPAQTEGKFFGYVFINSFSVVRVALGLLAAVLVLPALLL